MLRELAAERIAEAGPEDIGDRNAPDHGVGDVEMLGEHVGAGHEAVREEGAEQDRHAGAARNAEGDRRDERAAFLGVVGALRGDDAAHVALAEALLRAFLGRARRGRRRASRRPPPPMPGMAPSAAPIAAAAQDQPPVAGSSPWRPASMPRFDVVAARRSTSRCAGSARSQSSGSAKRPSTTGTSGKPVPEIDRVEGPAERPGLRVGPDHARP